MTWVAVGLVVCAIIIGTVDIWRSKRKEQRRWTETR